MFIDRLKVINYNRITQNFIEILEVNFSKPTQIVLGKNGSGKSSLMNLVLPCVPDSADFDEGGRYELELHANGGKHYEIMSDYGETGGHYFAIDGVVENNWGTATVQRSLIEREFGLNSDIHAVMTNAVKFTTMPTKARRDWIMFFSGIDIEPLMQRFIEAKEKQRDAKGFLNKITERLKIEEKNKIDDNIIADKRAELDVLKEEFNYYSNFSSESIYNPQANTLEERSSYLMDFMNSVSENMPKAPSWLIQEGVTDFNSLSKYLIETKATINFLENQHATLLNELKEVNKIAKARAALSEKGVKETEETLASIQIEIDKCEAILSEYGYALTSPAKQAKMDFTRIADQMRSILFDLPNNEALTYSTTKLNKAKEAIDGIGYRLTTLRDGVFKIEHQIKHIDEQELIRCPECHFNFKNGVKDSDRKMLLQELERVQSELNNGQTTLDENKKFYAECADYMDTVRGLFNTMHLTPSNLEFWAALKATHFYKSSTYPAIDLLDKHYKYLETYVKLEDWKQLKEKEEHILIQAKEYSVFENILGDESISKLDQQVFDVNQKLTDLKSKYELASMFSQRLTLTLERIDKIKALFDDFNLIYINDLENMRAEFIKDTKFNIMKEINFIEQELEQANVKNLIYRDVENQLSEAKRNYEEYSKIVTNLSPDTGLIADILNKSIEVFLEAFNNIVKSVWTSELTVLPCVNKRNDLDWRFPVRVENNQIRKDILKTSTSQQDIINLAFQLMLLNKLGHYPIVLDELGKSMDDQHRINLMHVLSDIVETNYCSQLFFISHFAAFHEQFTNNETLVLNTTNIINMPKVYNQHVTIN